MKKRGNVLKNKGFLSLAVLAVAAIVTLSYSSFIYTQGMDKKNTANVSLSTPSNPLYEEVVVEETSEVSKDIVEVNNISSYPQYVHYGISNEELETRLKRFRDEFEIPVKTVIVKEQIKEVVVDGIFRSIENRTNTTTVGNLDSGSITTGFGDINIGQSTLTAKNANFTYATSTNATSTTSYVSGTLGLNGDYFTDLSGGGLTLTDGVLSVTGLTSSVYSNMVTSFDSTGNLIATSTPSFSTIIATSTTATSTFAGGLNVGSGGLVYDYSTGFVGVGTTSPVSKLSVVGNSAFAGSASVGLSYAGTSAPNNGMIIQGNVGIGTTSPAAKLHISHDGGSSAEVLRVERNSDSYFVTKFNGSGTVTFDAIGSSPSFNFSDSIVTNGDLTASSITLASTDRLSFNSRSRIYSPDNGILKLTNATQSDFNRLQFGGEGSSFPALKRNGTGIDVRLADDSDYGALSAGNGYFAGNVGIGTTTPGAKLSVSGDALFDGSLTVTGITATSSISSPYFTATGASATSTFAGGATLATGGGNVGIGTSTPSSLLHIGTSGFGDPAISTPFSNALSISPNSVNVVAGLDWMSGTIFYIQAKHKTNGSTAFPLALNPVGGFVGIGTGTSAPSAVLHVKGTSQPGILVERDGTSNATILFRTSTGDVYAGQSLNGDFAIGPNANIATSPFAYFRASGNVGIGTSTPYAKLSVAGEGVFQNITATSTTADTNLHNTLYVDSSTGRVGVGTASPVETFQIGTDTSNKSFAIYGNASGSRMLYNHRGSGSTFYDSLWLRASNLVLSSTGSILTHGQNLTLSPAAGYDTVITSGNLGIGTTTPWGKLSVTNTGSGPSFLVEDSTSPDSTPFIIDASGNVGVGTVSPGAKLHVVGNIHASNGSISVGTSAIGSNHTATLSGSSLGIGGDGTRSTLSYDITNGNTTLNSSLSGSELILSASGDVILSPGGNVGIGTSTPYAKLSVAGEGVFQNITATSTTADTNLHNTLYVDSSTGRVGVGITAPDGKLHVHSTSAGSVTADVTADDLVVENTSDAGMSFLTGNTGTARILFGDVDDSDVGKIGYSHSAGRMFFVNGSEALSILNSGNVGIGTTTPGAKLSVSGDALFDGSLTVTGITATSSISSPYFTATGASATSTFAGGVNVGSGGLVYDHSTGRVGIGTAVPTVKLDVTATGSAIIGRSSGTGGATAVYGYNNQTTGSNYGVYGQTVGVSTGNSFGVVGVANGNASLMNIGLTGYAVSGTNNVQLLLGQLNPPSSASYGIYNSSSANNYFAGNLGIGINSPGDRLHVSGGSGAIIDGVGNVYLQLNSDTDADTTNDSVVRFAEGGSHKFVAGYDGSNDIFSIDNGSALGDSNFFTITTAGNIGIGTTSPQGKLNVYTGVSGATVNTAADELVVEGTSPGISILGPDSAYEYLMFGSPSDGLGAALRYNLDAGEFAMGSFNSNVYTSIWSGNSEKVRITTTGNVGIGTTSPYAKLSVTNTGSGPSFVVEDDTSPDTTPFAIDASGNVGIGTLSPGSKLHSLLTSGSGSIGRFENSGQAALLNITATAANTILLETGGSDILQFGTSAGGADLTIDTSGNVGIGTASPGSVSGALLHTYKSTGNNWMESESGGADSNVGSIYTNDATSWTLGVRGSDDDKFYIGNQVGLSAGKFVIDTSGNVGIGTSSPGSKLDVIGDVFIGGTSAAGQTNALKIWESSSTGGLTIQSEGANNNWEFHRSTGGANASRLAYGSRSIDEWHFEVDTLTTSNNFGIGTTAPDAGLHLKGTAGLNSSGFTTLMEIEGSYGTSARNHGIGFSITDKEPSAGIYVTENGGAGSNLMFTTATSYSTPTQVERMRIDSSGNVGIGTVSPDTNLEVSADSSNGIFLERSGIDRVQLKGDGTILWGATANQGLLSWNTGRAIVASQSGEDLAFSTGGVSNEALRITTGGNVGIGTASPESRLSVVATSAGAETEVLRLSNSSTDTSTAASLVFNLSTNAALDSAKITAIRTNSPVSSDSALTFSTISGGSIGERMRILPAGDVGIGTTSPYAKLSVTNTGSGPSFVVEDDTSPDTTPFAIDASGNVGIGTLSPGAKLDVVAASGVGDTEALKISRSGGYGATRLQQYYTNSGNIPYGTYFTVGLTELMRLEKDATGGAVRTIFSNGNVGIGLTDPGYNLEINGSVADSIAISNTGINHGLTSLAQTDVGAVYGLISTTAGGALVRGMSDTAASSAIKLDAVFGSTDPTDSVPALILNSAKRNTTAAQSLGASETVLQVQNNTSALLTVLGSGNVGIGTVSPLGLFTVEGGVTKLRNGLLSTNREQLRFGRSDDSGADIRYHSINTTSTSAASTNAMQFLVHDAVTTTSQATVMTLLGNGNVGVGIGVPATRFHTYEDSSTADNTTGLTIEQDGTGDSVLQFYLTSAERWNIGIDNSDSDKFKISDANLGGSDDNLVITTSGYVGIGTGNPGEKLNIAETVHGDDVGLKLNAEDTGGVDRSGFVGFDPDANFVYLANGNSVMEDAFKVGIDSSGNVGIGTTTPWGKLSVTNTGSGPSFVVEDSTSPDTSPFIIDASGNVGVGVTNPGAKLYVYDTSSSIFTASTGYAGDAIFNFINRDSGSTSNVRHILSAGGSTAGDPFTQYNISGVSNWSVGVDNSDSDKFQISTTIGVSASEVMTIDTSGNVGIGTTNPGTRLSISNSAASIVAATSGTVFMQETVTGVESALIFSAIADNGGTGNKGGIIFDAGATGVVADNILSFSAETQSTLRKDLNITGAGNVGVGTTSPSELLSVSGRLYSSGNGAATQGLIIEEQGNTPWYIHGLTGGAFGIARDTTGASGNVKFAIDTSGNVGIGTSVPGAKLSFGANVQETIRLYDSGSAGTSYGLGISSGEMQLFASSNQDISFRDGGYGGTVNMFMDGGTGYIGIGTTTPLDLLHIASYTNDARQIIDGATGFDSELKFAENGTVKFTAGYDSASTNFVIGTTNVDSSQRLVIDSSGNVGIGTASPNVKLHIGDSGSVSTRLQLTNSTSGSTSADGFQIQQEGNETYLWNYENSNMRFGTNNTTRMLIKESGNIGVGTTTPAEKFVVVGNGQFTAVASGTYSADLNLTSTGVLTTSSSDERLKTNIERMNASTTLEKILQLEPSTFNWKADPDGRKDLGLIAQEVEKILPEVVFKNKTDGFLGINYSRIPALLISAIQELNRKVESIALRLDTLTKTVEELSKKVGSGVATTVQGTYKRLIIEDELCIDGTCVDGNQLKELLHKNNVEVRTNVDKDGQYEEMLEETGTSTPEIVEEEVGTSTPEVVIEEEEEVASSTPEVIVEEEEEVIEEEVESEEVVEETVEETEV